MLRKTKYVESSSETSWFEWCQSLLDLYTTDKYFVSEDISRGSKLQIRNWILGHKMKGVEMLLRNLLLDAMISADTKNVGSGVYVPWFLYNQITENSTRLSSQKYLEATLEQTNDPEVREILKEIHRTVGPLTKIVLKPSYESGVVLKYRNSFCFPLGLDAQFHRMIGNTELIEQTNPIVIMIEGAPETVSEINSLLQWNHEHQRPVLLIARSFPEEVSATLATNWLRGSLSVLPIPYGNSIDSINLAADMCAITNGELISAHFGDIISAHILDEDKWGSVDRVEWSQGRLSLQKQVNIDGHIRNLIKKSMSVDEEIQEIYRNRILSLSNDALEVWIPHKKRFQISELDGLLKHYNAFIKSGLVSTPIGPVPKCFIDSAKESAHSLRKEILNIGGFLVGVKDEVVACR